MKYAIVATDQHPHYSFFAPLTAEAWRRVGYEPLVICVGEGSATFHLAMRMLASTGVRTERIASVPGYRTANLAQIARIYGWSLVEPDDYVIVSDVDMWPLRGDWFAQHEVPPGHLALLYANNRGRFPMCYVAAHGSVWEEVCQAPRKPIEPLAHGHILRHLSPATHAADAWQHDEEWLTARIHEWPGYPDRCRFVCRAAGEPPADRLDRGAWIGRAPEHVDAHLLRPGYDHWATLRGVLGDLPGWAETYVVEYVDALRRGG